MGSHAHHGFLAGGPGVSAAAGLPGNVHHGRRGRQSLLDEDVLYKLFGVNAELLIDHAWGEESCTIGDIKGYRPQENSIGSGQVLTCPYPFDKALLVIREMADALSMTLVEKGLATRQLALDVGYDNENVSRFGSYQGEIKSDRYGRQIPKPAHGVTRLPEKTASSRRIIEAVGALFEEIVDRRLTIRRMNLTALEVTAETEESRPPEQLNMFTDYAAEERRREAEAASLAREKKRRGPCWKFAKNSGKTPWCGVWICWKALPPEIAIGRLEATRRDGKIRRYSESAPSRQPGGPKCPPWNGRRSFPPSRR